MWDTHTGDLLREEVLPLFPRAPTSKGRYFIFTGDRKIGVFDFATGDVLWSIEGKDSASFLGLSPDDKWLIFLRGKNIECWELSNTDGKKISFTMRSSETVGNYKQKPTSISFAQDNNSFYCALRDNPVIVQWNLPDLKVLRRMRFPKFNIMKIQGPHDNLFLLEGISSNKILEGFSADMVKETAQRLVEHTGENCKIASLKNSQFLV
ncbi:MAG: WD40 repeat domain-containing protein, partial [Desulfobacterales bacterium]|nr:WD40 repeat domain-containing protein [Desulfobacterales bacterium]